MKKVSIGIMTIGLMFWGIPFSKAETIWYPLPREAYQFGKQYPEAQHLLFAFDYGHALIYERLLLNKGRMKDPKKFESEILYQILEIIKYPPHVKVGEENIAPHYAYAFSLALNLFDWSHLLHQFVFDILATSEERGSGMVERVNDITAQYKKNKSIAITDVCKTMDFMDGHSFSKIFREVFPRLNALIWSYHWFQIKLYEALMSVSQDERDEEVFATIYKFKKMISNLPDSADFNMMPQTAEEAPLFSHTFPTLAAAFDNNHMLHDIVSDILVSDRVPFDEILTEGIRVGRMALDPNAFRAHHCGGHPHPLGLKYPKPLITLLQIRNIIL